MYRFSVEWSRIEPEENQFDEAAVNRYRSWCIQLREAGIAPMVTLHHFSEPLWITDRGGFERRETVEAFGRFVRFVVPHMAGFVDHWVTINEPVVYAVMGWLLGEFPPGTRDGSTMGRVLYHLMLAHAEAYRAIHDLDTTDADGDDRPCVAGPAMNLVPFRAARRWHPLDHYLAHLLHRNYNRSCLDALVSGRLRVNMPGILKLDERVPSLAGTFDFIGVNHYFRLLARTRLVGSPRFTAVFDDVSEKNDMGWDLTPIFLRDALRFAASYGKPIFVTENGTCDDQRPDLRRERYLLESIGAVARAMKDGVDVRGYLYWSLLDNFEWSHGFGPRFGLYRVDYQTQERTLTHGGALYREIVATHRSRQR